MLFDVIVGSAQHHIADLLIITTQVTPAAVPKGKRLKYDLILEEMCYEKISTMNIFMYI